MTATAGTARGDTPEAETPGADTPGATSAPRPGPPRRPLRSRLSTGHVVMILAGLLAAVANFAVLRGQADTVEVLVAARDLAPGEHLAAGDLRPVGIEAAGAPLDALLTSSGLEGIGETVLATRLTAGSPVRTDDLRPVAAGDGLRRMSVPVAAERAAGGDIVVGDRVDVITIRDGRAVYVVADAPVLGVTARSPGAIGGGLTGFALTVAVDGDRALCLAEAIQGGALDVVVSTGQEAVEVAPCTTDATVPPTEVPPRAPATGAAGTLP